MTDEPRSGRPRASSRETIADAACELFLEQGYDATSIVDITTRAGVSRSSFFNYFPAKGDLFWAALDERLGTLVDALALPDSDLRALLLDVVDGFAPDSLALGVANADAMGVAGELERERAIRQLRLGFSIGERLGRDGRDPILAEVAGATVAAALFAAIWRWAVEPGRADLAAILLVALPDMPATDFRRGAAGAGPLA